MAFVVAFQALSEVVGGCVDLQKSLHKPIDDKEPSDLISAAVIGLLQMRAEAHAASYSTCCNCGERVVPTGRHREATSFSGDATRSGNRLGPTTLLIR